MPGGVLNLDGQTIFQSNNGIIEIPSTTFIKGISDLFDVFINNASFNVSTNILTLETNNGQLVSVDLSDLQDEITQTAAIETGLTFTFIPNPSLLRALTTTITVYGNETGGSQTIPVTITDPRRLVRTASAFNG